MVKHKKKSRKEIDKTQKQLDVDDKTLEKVYGRSVRLTAYDDYLDFKRIVKSPTDCKDCISKFNKLFKSPSYRRTGKHLCKKLFRVGMYKAKKYDVNKSRARKRSRSRKSRKSRKRSGSRKSRKSRKRSRSRKSRKRSRSRKSRVQRKRSGSGGVVKNVDVIFYGQPYYNAVISGDFTKINKAIDELNKMFKRKIGQSGSYGEHVVYNVVPSDIEKFKKKARQVFKKVNLHVSFDVSKSLKYIDNPVSRKHKMLSALKKKISEGLGGVGQAAALHGGDIFMTPDYLGESAEHPMYSTRVPYRVRWNKLVDKMVMDPRKEMIKQSKADQLLRVAQINAIKQRAALYTPEFIKSEHARASKHLQNKDSMGNPLPPTSSGLKNADEIYSNILMHVEDEQTLLLLAALRLEFAQLPSDALALYERVLTINPVNPIALFYASWLTYHRNVSGGTRPLQIANQRLKTFIDQNPIHNVGFILKFMNRNGFKDPSNAVRFLVRISTILPSELITPANIKLMQNDIRKHIEALDEFQKTNRDEIDEDSYVLPYFEEYKVDVDDALGDSTEIIGYDD